MSQISNVRFVERLTETTSLAPSVERRHVGVHVVQPIAVWWTLARVPHFGRWELAVQTTLRLAFVIDTVKANDTLKEDVKLRMRCRILCDFKQRLKDI